MKSFVSSVVQDNFIKPWDLDRNNGFQRLTHSFSEIKIQGFLCAFPRVAQLERGQDCAQRGPLFWGLPPPPGSTWTPVSIEQGEE